MKAVTVIPIDKGIFKEELSYFTSLDVGVGAIVSVPVRNKNIDALVVGVEDASKIKSALRTSSFALKKIVRVKHSGLFSPAFLLAAKQTADYFAAPRGQVIRTFVPKIILEQDKTKLSGGKKSTTAGGGETNAVLRQNKFVLQDSDEERLAYYKSLVRENFARKHSVFFCLPTVEEIERVVASLEKGIKEYTVILHHQLPRKEIIENWQTACSNEHPLLIVATPNFFSLPRNNIKTFIIDRESSEYYKDFNRPFADARTFAEFFAANSDARFIFGDVFLRVETLRRTDRSELTPVSPLKYRSITSAKTEVSRLVREPEKEEPFSVIDRSLAELVARSRENGEHLFIFTFRRGLAPLTVCNDCGQVTVCHRCRAPVVIHRTSGDNKALEKNLFICHKCGEVRSPEDTCGACGSWRLALLGVGNERVEEELKSLFPDLTIFRLDRDTAKTSKRANEIITKFLAAPGSVLLGTEMAMHHLHEKVENVAVASIDSLLAIPGFRTRERAFNLLLRLRLQATKNFLIQTRNLEEKIFDYVEGGHLLDFYREEVADRKEFYYPPFCVLLKISREGKKSDVQLDMKKLAKLLEEYEPAVFPAFTSETSSKYLMHALIKLEPGHWPEEKLLAVLKSLPPSFIVKIDPEDIL